MDKNGNSKRPTVTITTYSTLKRIERQQREPTGQNDATSSELSTDFFKVNRQVRCTSLNSNETNNNNNMNINNNNNNRQRSQTNRSRVLIDLSQIKGPTGSVRGHHNVVRRSLEGIKMAYNRRSVGQLTTAPPPPLNRFNFSTFVSARTTTSSQHASLSHQLTSVVNSAKFSLTNNNNNSSSLSNSQQYIDSKLYCLEYLERLVEEEQNLCVAYTTTLGVIRRTFEDSKTMKSILNLNLINYEERDIYLNQEYRFQLKMRLDSISVPALFVDGQHIGGVKELETMNENGDLAKVLSKFKMSKAAKRVCHCCGNAKFIACQSCNGSRKSTIHHFKFNSIALRCIKCDKNDGLIRCPVCCSESLESPSNDYVYKEDMFANQHKVCVNMDKNLRSSTLIDDINENFAPILMIDENNNNAGDLNLKSDLGNEVSTC